MLDFFHRVAVRLLSFSVSEWPSSSRNSKQPLLPFLLLAQTSGVRTGGFGGQPPPPLKILKEMKTSLSGTNRRYSYRDCRNCSHVFLCFQLAHKILKKFHCDAIIGLPVVKLCWCAALDVDDCRKKKPFFFETNRLFFVRSLPQLLSCFLTFPYGNNWIQICIVSCK